MESYDPNTDTWRAEATLKTARNWPVAWVANGNIFIVGSYDPYRSSIEVYNQMPSLWNLSGSFPVNIGVADAVVLNDKVYVIAGHNGSSYSNKVFAADLNASVAGIYDLYRKDGNASAGTPIVQAEVADGSVTTAKLDATILKYLKPEITVHPQAQTVYADTNISFSVTAEGKYLTYQWKKDGNNLTGETNATFNITDANATQHDGNYSVVVSNDFGSVESGVLELKVIDAIMNGLVAWWKFDETNGTVAYDSSGNGNDGNLSGGLTWTTGKIGGALSFDGVNDLVRVNGNWPSSNSPRAISVWFFTNNTHRGNIFTFGDGARINTRFSVLTNYGENGNLHFCGQGNDVGLGSMTFNQWRHLCVTYSSNLINAFVDNQLFASVSKNLNTDGSMPLIVGSNSLTRDDEFFSGKLDDLRVYDRALSAAEVQALYNMGQ